MGESKSTEAENPPAAAHPVALASRIERLPAGLAVGAENRRSLRRTALDTFDWQLHAAGVALWLEEEAGPAAGRHLLWRRLEDGLVERRALVEAVPGFASELAPGPLRDALAPLTGIRRLLPRVELVEEVVELPVVDGEGKTVVRLALRHGSARHPPLDPEAADGGRLEAADLPPRLTVTPVKGYEAAAEAVLAALADCDLPLGGADDGAVGRLGGELGGELDRVAAAVGIRAGDYSSKPTVALDPEMNAGAAVRRIFLALLDTIEANEEGTRADLDSEFLHDFRVAVRRTRSGLSQIKGVLPPAVVERFKKELSWLGKITGPTRDLDVFLLKMPDYRRRLPAGAAAELAPLAEHLRRCQRREQAKLARSLSTERYQRLKRAWRRELEKPQDGAVEGAPNADRPVREVASERIFKVYRRVIKKGGRIDDDTPAEALHRLRIDCKKLRYLMEFFRGLYRPAEIDRLIKALKKLQDNLGDFNDYEVQQGELTDHARQMAEEGRAPVETLLAMGRLLTRLEEGQAAERHRFGKRFARFSSAGKRKAAEKLFGSSGA